MLQGYIVDSIARSIVLTEDFVELCHTITHFSI